METQVSLTNAFVPSAEQANKYISIIQAVHRIDIDQARGIYLAEVDFFMKAMEGNADLMGTTYESKLGVFVDVITNGLSFSPHLRYVYIEKRWTVIKGHPQGGEARLAFKESPQGRIYLCQVAGSIERVTPPEMVYAGDTYEVFTANGIKNIKHQRNGKSNTIVAGFCYVVTPNGDMQGHEMTIAEDIERLKGYSTRQNKNKGANALYTSDNGQIDKGFFIAKLIKHSLKWYRSKRIISTYLDEGNADEEMGTDYRMTFPTEPAAPLPIPVPATPATPISQQTPSTQNIPGDPLYPEFAPPTGQYVDWSQTQYAQPIPPQQQPPLTHPEPSPPPQQRAFAPPPDLHNDMF